MESSTSAVGFEQGLAPTLQQPSKRKKGVPGLTPRVQANLEDLTSSNYRGLKTAGSGG